MRKTTVFRHSPLPAVLLALSFVASSAPARAQTIVADLSGPARPEPSSTGGQDPSGAGEQYLPNMNQTITPLAAVGSRFVPMNPALADFPAWLAQNAAHCVVSPDGKTLLVLTSGYNRVYYPYGTNANAMNLPDSTEYVFVYDISKGAPGQ